MPCIHAICTIFSASFPSAVQEKEKDNEFAANLVPVCRKNQYKGELAQGLVVPYAMLISCYIGKPYDLFLETTARKYIVELCIYFYSMVKDL